MRTILITGASGGLGAALANALATADTSLVLVGRDETRLRAVKRECEKADATVHLIVGDIRHDATLAAVEQHDTSAPIDLAILNAGILSGRAERDAPEDEEAMTALVATNLTATILWAQRLSERMRARKEGHLLLVSSLNALYPAAAAPTYSATKAAVHSYGVALGDWLAPQGVAVTVVLPGFFESGFNTHYDGPRPLEWTADKAAAHIVRKLSKRPATIAFPLVLRLGIAVNNVLPTGLRRWIARQVTVRIDG